MSVAVVVPWRAGCPHREAAWGWVRARYTEAHPTWEIVEATAPDGPWVKANAVMPAIAETDADVVVVSDADVWCDSTLDAVAHLDTVRWARPHYRVHRLTQSSTGLLLDGHGPHRLPLAESHRGLRGGGIVVARRADLLDIPLDPRFEGWGGEDQAWGLALLTMLGDPWEGRTPLWHLWHPPQARQDRYVGNDRNEALRRRYGAARRKPDQMRALLDEHREQPWPATSRSSSSPEPSPSS